MTEALIDRVLQVVEMLKAHGEQPDEYRTDGVRFWEYEDVASEIRAIAEEIVALNSEMLSVEETARYLQWPILTNVFDGRCYEPRTYREMEPREYVAWGIEQRRALASWTILEALLLHMPLDRESDFVWGEVTFERLNPYDLRDDVMAGWAVKQFNGRMNATARVNCPGDGMYRMTYFNETVETALRTLLGALWPLYERETFLPPSIVGRGPDAGSTPYRSDGAKQFGMTRLAPGHPPFALPSSLEELWGTVQSKSLIDLAAAADRTELQSRLLAGLGWLGEAAKPDVASIRFVKIATALETLVGDEDPTAGVTARGVTATLAERASFRAGKDRVERAAIHDQVVADYGARSEVLHRGGEVGVDRLDAFGGLTWRVANALHAHLDQLETTLDLRGWILEQRYA